MKPKISFALFILLLFSFAVNAQTETKKPENNWPQWRGPLATGAAVKDSETFEVLAINEVDDNFHASLVIVGNDLILRGFNSLYCFSEE